ncbi:zinc ribbon domain-containing protein [Salinivibrio sp. AR647]|nr:zinc ribbon domain-containing protein [Salinivibrio sp. AR640]OOE92974.1 zinc ribbon domain-containing protein [Salinivibrio sp. AR647]
MMIIIWFILAIFVAFYASSKGRSGLGFFLISLILSPLIGFIIALVVEERSVEIGEMKKCPMCAEMVRAEAKLCKHCHSELA